MASQEKAIFGPLAWWLAMASVVFSGCREREPGTHRIASSSMAPGLQGPGLVAKCTHCRSEARIAAETYRSELPVRCYRCGGIGQVESELLPGDEVRIEPLETVAAIRRFERVAFRGDAPQHEIPTVKRVWGLPGEHLEIRDGELWQNGKLFQKSLDELLQVGVVLARFPDRAMGLWSRTGVDGSEAIGDLLPKNLLLKENHALCWSYQRPAQVELQETPPERWRVAATLDDDYVANQGLSYQLQPVPDYFLTVRFRKTLEAPCVLSCRVQDRWLRIRLEPPGDASEPSDGSALPVVGKLAWTVGLCEGRILVRSDLSEFVRECSEFSDGLTSAGDASELFSLKCLAGAAELEELTIGRDLYLRTTHRSGAGSQSFQVSQDAFFVLGDNLPASVDSRGELGTIASHRILGFVKKHPASSR